MSEEYSDYGSDFITITAEDGTQYELEELFTFEFMDRSFTAFLPADIDENDPRYGLLLLEEFAEEDGTRSFEQIDDDDIDAVYEEYMRIIVNYEDDEVDQSEE